MNQKSYIEEVLKRFNIKKCKPIGTPFDVNLKLLNFCMENLEMCRIKMKGITYEARVGSLIYTTVATRANITFKVSTVSQFTLKVGPPHWMAVRHIMRYLKGTLDFKLCVGGKDIALRRLCDMD